MTVNSLSASISVISNSIQLLVQDLDAACDPALTAMSKVGHPLHSSFPLLMLSYYIFTFNHSLLVSLPLDAMAECRACRWPKSLRDVSHHAHQTERPHHQREPGLHTKILHPVLHQVHQVSYFPLHCSSTCVTKTWYSHWQDNWFRDFRRNCQCSEMKTELIFFLVFFFSLSSFIPKFINHLFRCKPISMVGAEQVNILTLLFN